MKSDIQDFSLRMVRINFFPPSASSVTTDRTQGLPAKQVYLFALNVHRHDIHNLAQCHQINWCNVSTELFNTSRSPGGFLYNLEQRPVFILKNIRGQDGICSTSIISAVLQLSTLYHFQLFLSTHSYLTLFF